VTVSKPKCVGRDGSRATWSCDGGGDSLGVEEENGRVERLNWVEAEHRMQLWRARTRMGGRAAMMVWWFCAGWAVGCDLVLDRIVSLVTRKNLVWGMVMGHPGQGNGTVG
jgi:hypothetical protein